MISAGSRLIFFANSATVMPSVYTKTSGNSWNLRAGTAGFAFCSSRRFPFLPFWLRFFLLKPSLLKSLKRCWFFLSLLRLFLGDSKRSLLLFCF